MATEQTILWVDDDAQFVRDVLAVWHPHEQVTAVRDCAEARRELADHSPALVILDLKAPDPSVPAGGEGGLGLLEYIRRECRTETPVLVVTGDDRPAILNRAAGLGAYAILPKSNAIVTIAKTAEQKL
jgi:CheY-like chemotaxis protein